MKTVQISMVVATAVCVAFSGAVLAGQEKMPELQRDGAAAAKGLTVSGCVARGASSGTYTLANNAKSEAAPTGVDQPATVTLAGTDVDLAPHLGHIVALTGSYVDATEPTGPVGTAGTEPPAPAADAKKPLRTFTVKSLKMIATSCPEAAQ